MKFSQPNITTAEIDAVTKALVDGHLATGTLVRRFEQKFTEMFGYQHVVAVNSGTTALTLALMALGVGRGDEVIVTAYSIMATANAILAVGARPVFCDVERSTYNLDAALLPALITERTKAILPASIFGVPCDVSAIRTRAPGIPIVEDSIEALGAKRAELFVGQDADIATFGFYPNKQITTCFGGVLFSSNSVLMDRARVLRTLGYGPNGDLWNQGFGGNFQLADPLAAMGIVQLDRFWGMQSRLSEVAALLDGYFGSYRKQKAKPGHTPTHFIYGIELPEGTDKRRFCDDMASSGIPVRPYFNAMHRVAHVAEFYRPCPVADELGGKTVALPFHWDIDVRDAEQIRAAFFQVTGPRS